MTPHEPIHDHAPRAVGIVGLLAIGLIHLLDSIGKYHETRYLFWLYVALIAGTVLVSGWLLHRPSRLAWTAAGTLALTAIVGYCLSRTTGLPSASGDVGNWKEPLGMASLFVEGCLVSLSAYTVAVLGRVTAARPAGQRRRRDFAAGHSQVGAGA
jgi:hypothetical protein